jgi:hypothetical protein
MSVGFDPKIIVLALIVLAGAIYYFTSSSSDFSGGGQATANVPAVRPIANPTLAARTAAGKRNAVHNDRAVLKLIPVDGSRGDVDPTLRLSLLERLKGLPPAGDMRNLFDVGDATLAGNLPPVPKNAPKIPVGPTQPIVPPVAVNTPPPPPPFSIPLKYYGFVRPSTPSKDGSRGFFMDGDNILVGGEGDVLEKHFLIVSLTPNVARLEDTQAKQGQDLHVTPEAPPAP